MRIGTDLAPVWLQIGEFAGAAVASRLLFLGRAIKPELDASSRPNG
jgi:hypothetical protein